MRFPVLNPGRNGLSRETSMQVTALYQRLRGTFVLTIRAEQRAVAVFSENSGKQFLVCARNRGSLPNEVPVCKVFRLPGAWGDGGKQSLGSKVRGQILYSIILFGFDAILDLTSGCSAVNP